MFCTNCGKKSENNAEFCHNCGAKLENDTKGKAKKIPEKKTPPTPFEADILIYSQEWLRTNGFAVAALPYYDILIDQEGLYVLKLPKPFGRAAGIIIGFLVFRIIGAIIGAAIGFGIDRKKHQRVRSLWINSDHKLISEEYKRAIFLKIPKEKIKTSITMKGARSIKIVYNNEKVVLKRNKKERARLKSCLESI